MKVKGILLGFLIIVLGAAVSTHAALVDMGDGTIYDTDTQLSWLKDVAVGGDKTWGEAIVWAASLNAGGGFAGLTGWRLPDADPACTPKTSCPSSEMGHLFYTELGNVAGGPLSNTGPFTTLRAYYHWTGTEVSFDPNFAITFYFDNGSQYTGNKTYTYHAWAVSPGERAVCGDGIVESGEQCDDNNTAAGDGCSATCTIESGYSCSGSPSVCTPSATSVGYDLEWLIITLASLMLAGRYLLRRKKPIN